MAQKKRPKQFSVVQAVKRNARERVGSPRPERVLIDLRTKRRTQRQRPPLARILSEEA